MASEKEHAETARSEPSQELRLHYTTETTAQYRKLPQLPLPAPPPPPPPPLEQPAGRSWYFNAAFAGPSRVGKSKLIQRFVDSQFRDGYAETTETAPLSKSVSIGRHHVLFQCWDTPGAETLTDGLDPRLRFPHALFILFDVSRDTSSELERWCRLIDTCGPPRPLLVLVGNKSDLGVHEEALSRARELSQFEGGLFFLLSVLADDENMEVDAMMLEVGKALTERYSLALLSPNLIGPCGEAAGDAKKGSKSELWSGRKPGTSSEGPVTRLREMLAACCCQCCG